MKIISYSYCREEGREGEDGTISFPVEAFGDVFLRYTSVEEALKELMCEGYTDENGNKVFRGLRDLLELIKSRRELLSLLVAGKKCGIFPDEVLKNYSGYSCIDDTAYASEENRSAVSSGIPKDRGSLYGIVRLINETFLQKEELPRETIELLDSYLDRLRRLEKKFKRVSWGYDVESIEGKEVEELLGREVLKSWCAIKNLKNVLFQLGYIEHGMTGLELTPLGLRKLSWNMVREIFRNQHTEHLSSRVSAGSDMEPCLCEGTRPYQFGDCLLVDVSQSLLNAVKRTNVSKPLHLEKKDFVIYQRLPVQRTATVVLLDLSKSMRFENRILSAKKVTLALFGIVRQRFPSDCIVVVGFSTKVKNISLAELPFLTYDAKQPYTNMEEALDTACRILLSKRNFRKQIFLITDGEPTAHRENNSLFFQSPPHPETLRKTIGIIGKLVRQKIGLSIFLLSQEKDSLAFMYKLARKTKGKVFQLNPDNLGKCLLADYVKRKSKWL